MTKCTIHIGRNSKHYTNRAQNNSLVVGFCTFYYWMNYMYISSPFALSAILRGFFLHSAFWDFFSLHSGVCLDVLKYRPNRFCSRAIESYTGFNLCIWGGGDVLWSLNALSLCLRTHSLSLSFCVNLSPVCTRACVNRGLKGTDMSAKQKHALKIKPPMQTIIASYGSFYRTAYICINKLLYTWCQLLLHWYRHFSYIDMI